MLLSSMSKLLEKYLWKSPFLGKIHNKWVQFCQTENSNQCYPSFFACRDKIKTENHYNVKLSICLDDLIHPHGQQTQAKALMVYLSGSKLYILLQILHTLTIFIAQIYTFLTEKNPNKKSTEKKWRKSHYMSTRSKTSKFHLYNISASLSQAAVCRYSSEQLFFEVKQYSQRNTCVGVSF